ncbi:MAG: solute carrier family 23 protein [Odoribacter sp.]
MQKLFALMGLTMTVQVLWGHRLPLVIGPASVLLIGILATISVGINAVYTAIMVGGLLLAILAYSGFLSRLQYIFTPRIIIVILCLIAFTLSPVILRLTFGDGENSLFHLLFVLLLVFVMLLGNKLLRGIWKSVVVLCGIIVGSLFYYGILGFPIVSQATGIADGAFSLIQWPWEFDISAILSFVFCFIALILNELGSIQAVGKMIGADQLGKRTRRGVGLTGIVNVLSMDLWG